MLRRLIGTLVVVALASGVAGCDRESAAVPISFHTPSSFVVQTGANGRWQSFNIGPYEFVSATAGHDDKVYALAYSPSQLMVVRIDMTGNVSTLLIDGRIGTEFNFITPNPDGNVYACVATLNYGGFAVEQIAPSGAVTEFLLPGTDLALGIVSGSDGNLWVLRSNAVDRMTTTGEVTEFLSPNNPNYSQGPVRGADKNLWFSRYSNSGEPVLVRVSVADGSQTTFPLPADAFNIVEGPDGNLWFQSRDHNLIYEANMSGTITSYPLQSQATEGPISGPNHKLYWNSHFKVEIFNVVTHSAYGISPAPVTDTIPVIGPDKQLWLLGRSCVQTCSADVNVFLLHQLVTTPASVVVTAGASVPLTVAEPGSPTKNFTAVSADPGIASVQGSGKNFVVTGVAHGATTITVSDSIGNSLDVPVTVQ